MLTLAGVVAVTGIRAEESPARAAQSGEVLHEPDGRAYRVERIAKAGAKYERIDAHTVRYFPFARYELAGEDADWFYVKQYVAGAQKRAAMALPVLKQIGLPSSRRFALRDAGRGLPHAGQWRDDFALADVDGDGHVDIAFAPARKTLAKPVILRGDGHGTWTRWDDARFPSLPYDYGAAVVADFNGDGRADLALGMHLRGIAVLTGDGKGRFERYDRNLPLGLPGSKTPARYSTHEISAFDWNRDGRPDLITVDERLLGRGGSPAAVSVFTGKRGSWTRAVLPANDVPRGNASLATLAGERKDLAIVVGAAPDGRIRAYEFAAGRGVSRELDGLPAGAIVRASAAADPAGDGKHAIAVAYVIRTAQGWQSAIDLFRRSGERYLREPLLVEPALTIGALAFGHLASARAFDLAALGSDGSLLLFAATPAGAYTRDHVEPAPAWRAGCSGHALHLRDLDGDGRDEIVAAFAGEPNALQFRRDCVSGGGIDAWQVVDAARQD
ncbi:MAG: FG-GAP repeat domain-containing protein [Dokdonella sp.]|uniref:FG-GAP repeat domain-containing protein n=1 Tax=Dokdonella sp. TaxID=2291710 RepID=UPI003F7E8AD6